jgi:hypothetical protein
MLKDPSAPAEMTEISPEAYWLVTAREAINGIPEFKGLYKTAKTHAAAQTPEIFKAAIKTSDAYCFSV